MAGGIVPASVKDPALRALLEQLISATGVGRAASGPTDKLGKQWRITEDRYPTQSGPVQELLQWRNGTRWDTKFALDGNGNIIALGGATINGSATVSGAETLGGNLTMTGANAASSTAFKNVLNPSNLCKAWALLTTGTAPTVVVTAGFNVASASYATNTITVILAQAMANTAYVVLPVYMGFVSTGMTAIADSTTQFRIGPGGGGGNVGASQLYGIAVFGAQ